MLDALQCVSTEKPLLLSTSEPLNLYCTSYFILRKTLKASLNEV